MKIYKIQLLFCFAILMHSKFSWAQSNHLLIEDTRDIPTSPTDFSHIIKPSFKYSNVVGLTSGYSTLLSIRGWRDDSGGPAHELGFTESDGIYYRYGYSAGWNTWQKIIIENHAGNVGIGTLNPTERLAVNGNIRAKEIKVETANWPDYVFKPDYDLKPLSEIESFIRINGHLPEIPKASQIESDGLSLGEMNKLLLKKIEELTLHLIEKDKEIKDYAQLILDFDKRIKILETKQR